MSKIETAIEQTQIKETDKNRSIEDLLMDVIGCLVDAKRNKEKRGNLDRFSKKIETSRSYKGLIPDIPPQRAFEVIYNETIKSTLEDYLACAIIKILEISKIKDVLPIETDSQNYYKYHWIGESIPKYIYDIIEVFYAPCAKDNLSKISIVIKRIEILSKLLKIPLWHHVDLRLKYNQVK